MYSSYVIHCINELGTKKFIFFLHSSDKLYLFILVWNFMNIRMLFLTLKEKLLKMNENLEIKKCIYGKIGDNMSRYFISVKNL